MMVRIKFLSIVSLAGGLLVSPVASAQETRTLELSDALFFDCSITENSAPTDPITFKISYLVYADRPDDPKVSLFDPKKIVFTDQTGPGSGSFILSQHPSGGPLFVWAGQRVGDKVPNINASIEVTPSIDDPTAADIVIQSFVLTDDGEISLRRYSGDCEASAGKDAYYKFAGGGD